MPPRRQHSGPPPPEAASARSLNTKTKNKFKSIVGNPFASDAAKAEAHARLSECKMAEWHREYYSGRGAGGQGAQGFG